MKIKHEILVVDDMSDYREMISLILQEKGYVVHTAACVSEAIKIINSKKIEIVVTDLIMKDETGIQLLKWIKKMNPEIGVILVTAYATVETAVEALKIGAYNYFIKSCNPESLLFDINKFLEEKCSTRESELKILDGKVSALLDSKNDIYNQLLETCDKIAQSDISVLILGESGVGKEVIAKYIHSKSLRKDKKFLEVNCQEYSEGVLESEIFGHEKGSFTGAISKKIGKFELANQGTLFLDEIADVSLNTQVKLLRVIENKKIERVGGNEKIDVDIRLISATNKDIYELIEKEEFRADFLYRINGIVLCVPPLRERPEDIDSFIKYFIKKSELKFGKTIDTIDDNTLHVLREYHYPGNIRELKTIIERLVVLSENGRIEYNNAKYYLPIMNKSNYAGIHSKPVEEHKYGSLQDIRRKAEKEYIKDIILQSKGNLAQASLRLDISDRQLRNKITDYNLKEWLEKNRW